MTAHLPTPGSIWFQPLHPHKILMRVIYSEPHEVIAHNCEVADRMPPGINPESWRGTPEQFQQNFLPNDPNQYPKTAK